MDPQTPAAPEASAATPALAAPETAAAQNSALNSGADPAAAPVQSDTPPPKTMTADDYAFTPTSEALKPYFAKSDDPAMANARSAAAELGIAPEIFSALLEKTFGPLAEQGAFPAPFDAAAELRRLGQAWGHGETPEGRAALSRELGEIVTFAENFAKSAGLDPAAAGELSAMADTAAGAQALRAIQRAVAGGGPTPGGAPAAAMSLASLQAQMTDERYNPSSPKYDRAWRADLDKRIQTHPSAPRG